MGAHAGVRSDYVLTHSVGGRERQLWPDELLPSEVLRRNFYFFTLDEPISPEELDVGRSREPDGRERLSPCRRDMAPHQERLYSRLSWMSEVTIEMITCRNAATVFQLDADRLMSAAREVA